MKNFIYILLFFIAGCGFHLRGTVNIPKSLKNMKVSPNAPYEPLQRELRQVLINKNVKISSPRAQGVTDLHVSRPVYSEQVIAIGANNQPTQLKMQIEINYSLYDQQGKLIQGPTKITASKDFSINPGDILGSDTERESLKQELRHDVVIKLLRVISK